MEGRLVREKEHNGFRFEFVSRNGIHYHLLEGVTWGTCRATSGYIFITLDIFEGNAPEEAFELAISLMGGSTTKCIDYYSSLAIMSNDPLDYVEDNETIRTIVDRFEKENGVLIALIKKYGIDTRGGM